MTKLIVAFHSSVNVPKSSLKQNKAELSHILRNNENKLYSAFDRRDFFVGFFVLMLLHYAVGLYKVSNTKTSI